MAKKVVKVTKQDAEAAANLLTSLTLDYQELNTQKAKEYLEVLEKYKEKIDLCADKMEEAQATILTYAEENTDDVFGTKKSIKIWGVTIAKRTVLKWVLPEGRTWDDLLADVKKTLKDYVRTKESVDIEALRADFDKNTAIEKKLKEIGVSLDAEDTYKATVK